MKKTRSQSGQMIIETILLITVLLGITLVVSTQFRNSGFFVKLVSGPWQNMAGLIQNGVWAPPNESMELHPNNHARHVTLKGEAPN